MNDILTIIIILILSALGTFLYWDHGRQQYVQGRCDAFGEISHQILERDPRLHMDDEEAAAWPTKAAIHEQVMDRWRRSINAIIDVKVYREIKKEAR